MALIREKQFGYKYIFEIWGLSVLIKTVCAYKVPLITWTSSEKKEKIIIIIICMQLDVYEGSWHI